jgi:hypothetical protein
MYRHELRRTNSRGIKGFGCSSICPREHEKNSIIAKTDFHEIRYRAVELNSVTTYQIWLKSDNSEHLTRVSQGTLSELSSGYWDGKCVPLSL